MAFVLRYSCKCGFSTTWILDGQAHANATGHTLDVTGTLTAEERALKALPLSKDELLYKRMREAEILRIARDRNLLRKPDAETGHAVNVVRTHTRLESK